MPPSPPSVSSLSRHYTISRLIGKGSYGTVVLATSRKTKHEVAIKSIPVNHLTAEQSDRIQAEIDVQSAMDDRHIIKIYRTVQDSTSWHIVTEFAAGGDLLQLVTSTGRMTEMVARRHFYELCQAVSHVHSKGYIHRDLKLENIFLSGEGHVKLGDFGFAGSWAPMSLQRGSYGSLHYASPEIVNDEEYMGPEVDCWSLGVILFALICGSFPFGGRTDAEIADRISAGLYLVPSFVSPLARDLIQGLLEVDPLCRLSVREVLKHPWLDCLVIPPLALGVLTRPRSHSDESCAIALGATTSSTSVSLLDALTTPTSRCDLAPRGERRTESRLLRLRNPDLLRASITRVPKMTPRSISTTTSTANASVTSSSTNTCSALSSERSRSASDASSDWASVGK